MRHHRPGRQALGSAMALLLASCALAAQADQLVDSFADLAAWTPNRDGGNPPEMTCEPDGKHGQCIRLRYTDRTPQWGNVRRDLSVFPAATGVRFWLRVNRAAPSAALHVWLFEEDRDGYLVRVRPGGKELADLDNAWREVTVPFSAFRYQPRGDRKREFLSIEHMLFGCNYGDFDVCVDELRLVSDEVKPMPMPVTENLPMPVKRTARGSVAVLAEPTFPHGSSHPDPSRLRDLLVEAGFGVTMLRAGDVCRPEVLTPPNVDVLLLPASPYYPAAGRTALRAYLKAGGAFLAIGGYAFDELLLHTSDGWSKQDPSVTAAQMDSERAAETGINTRYGQHGDTMKLHRDQIGVFDPSYLLDRVHSLRACPGQYLLPESWSSPTAVEGLAAIAMTGSNSPVFPDVHARWIPLLEGVDRFGRSRGAVGALVHSFSGPYAGASWAFLGVTDRDLFDGRLPGLDGLLPSLVDRLCRPVYLHDLRTDLACYRQGEAVTLSVSAYVGSARNPQVHLDIEGQRVATCPVDGDQPLNAKWAPVHFDRDFYHVRAVLETDGRAVDEMETGFVVWDDAVIASGPRIVQSDNYLEFRNTPTFLAGANQTGMMWYSANEDPLVWYRDFEKMNDCAQNLLRILHFSPFARDAQQNKHPFSPLDLRQQPLATQRQTDAIVQLAQKHNVVVFLTLHDWMAVELTDEELDAQRTWNAFWAARYRDVPGIIYDVQNEPRVRVPARPDMTQLAEAWLTQRYGSLPEAGRAWGQEGGTPSLDFGAKPQGWSDLKARDLDLFRTVLFDRWTKANVDGVKQGAPDALVTVGHLQHTTAADKLLGAANLDFTNTHFYGSVRDYRRILKMIDRRFEGKSFSLGEFGSRIAHDARTHGKWGDPAEASVAYYLAVGHYACGMGAAFMANWDWRDFRDCVFPWGINHADLVSKPVLEAYRNMALLFRQLRPRYEPPEVYLLVADSHRFGPHSDELHKAIMRSIDWLFGCHIPFGIINEGALDRLPATARALLWPLPYCPTDATFDKVRALVASGTALYFSGDIRFSARRQPERNERLAALGLTYEPQALDPFADGVAMRSPDPRWADTGKGRVCWVPRPLELRDASEGPTVYSDFLERASIRRPTVVNTAGTAHVFELPLVDGSALIVYNDSDSRQTVAVSGSILGAPAVLELDGHSSGLLAVDRAARVLVAEAQGQVLYDGKQVLDLEGHAGLAALDGRDLRQSGMLLATPFGAGGLKLHRSRPQQRLTVEVGEFKAGQWVTLAQETLTGAAAAELRWDTDSPFDLRLLAVDGKIADARAAAERLLNRR